MNQPITDSAPAVETVDVEPVNKPEQRAQYEKRRKIHPRRVHGTFRRLKWISMAVMLAIYYLSPWIRWDRIGQPRGLIGYDTVAGLRRKADQEVGRPRIIRARRVTYTGLIALVGGIMLATLLSRSPLDVNVLRDRNPLFVKLTDGGIRNGYTVKILNKHHEIRSFDLKLSGITRATISIIGTTGTRVTVGPDRLRGFRVFVKTPRGALTSDSTAIRFDVTDRKDGRIASHDSTLRGPAR